MGELYNPFPKLPKNIRQIGERDQIVKLYMEDYVNTYLKHLHPVGGQDLRVGLLLGNVEIHDGTPYIFIDGAMEMEDVTEEGEKVVFSEAAWKKAYQNMEQMFPKRTVQGWFLCGSSGSQLSPLNYWKQHGQYFPGKHKLMYLNFGLEGEESVYITSEDGFYKLRGHSIYYERNQMMQDYMILRKDVKRVESGNQDTVIRDFRTRMEERKVEAVTKRSTIGTLRGICGALSILVLAGGIVMFNNFEKMKEMESVITSALPEKNSETTQHQILLEEASGNVYPTQEQSKEPWTNQETMAPLEEQTQTSLAQETKATEPKTEAPETAATSAVSEEAGQVYVVGDGETLFGICLEVYHSLDQIDEICELNGLDNQDKIISGQKLILP